MGGEGLNVLVYVVSEATRNSFRDHKITKIFLGEDPQTPLICVVTIVLYNSLSEQILYENLKYYNIVFAPPQFNNYCICPLLTKILDETLAIPTKVSCYTVVG